MQYLIAEKSENYQILKFTTMNVIHHNLKSLVN